MLLHFTSQFCTFQIQLGLRLAKTYLSGEHINDTSVRHQWLLLFVISLVYKLYQMCILFTCLVLYIYTYESEQVHLHIVLVLNYLLHLQVKYLHQPNIFGDFQRPASVALLAGATLFIYSTICVSVPCIFHVTD